MKVGPSFMLSFNPISNLLLQDLQENIPFSNTFDYHKSKTCTKKILKLNIEVKIYEHNSLKIKSVHNLVEREDLFINQVT